MAVDKIKNPNAATAITLTPLVNITNIEYSVERVGNIVIGYIAGKNSTGSTLSDTTELFSGFPTPVSPTQCMGMTVGGTDDRKATRTIIKNNGRLGLWYGGSLPNSATLETHFSYVCQ